MRFLFAVAMAVIMAVPALAESPQKDSATPEQIALQRANIIAALSIQLELDEQKIQGLEQQLTKLAPPPLGGPLSPHLAGRQK
jgi:hypothetical protein